MSSGWLKHVVCPYSFFFVLYCQKEMLSFPGPKLFKEPSFKSNKFIIHNALSRCCLAGKVNETQKNKIVEVGGFCILLSSYLL